MLGSLSGAFLLKSHHYLKVKENLLCCLSGRQFKVNQHEWKKKKKANLLCNKSHICLFLLYWGSIMCWMPAENCNSLHQTSPSPTMHLWGMAKPLLRPGCLTRSQQQLQLRRSHRSQTHAHSDAAGFSVINKKWRHEVLAGWLAGRTMVTFSIKVISFWPHACSLLHFCFLVEHFWGRKRISVTLAAVCRVKGMSQQVAQGSLISKIPLRGSDVKDFKVLLNLKDTGTSFFFFFFLLNLLFTKTAFNEAFILTYGIVSTVCVENTNRDKRFNDLYINSKHLYTLKIGYLL